MVAYAFNPGRQDLWEFKANLTYLVSSRTTRTTQRDPISKKKVGKR